ncbi:MAG: ATP-binding cassette domain-containing protein [Desulfobacteraceae bacterium]|nr:ATP-binding cassette domain-containing protein [Desulfobacteraceae bacterium]
MSLIGMRDVCVAFGGAPLLDHVSLHIEARERVCLLGRNGAGKSTLMRLLHGDLQPDEGEIVYRQGVRVSYLPQEVPREIVGSVRDVVAAGLSDSEQGAISAGSMLNRVEKTISRMDLNPEEHFETLSAGMKRRVLLARGLVSEPDVLLLDEPTNHLDIEAITWMEEFLQRHEGTILFVTHDRMFLQKLATRTIELDRGRLIDWSCDYETFQKRKAAVLEEEAGHWEEFDKKLAREETWVRQGIKARRTRNEGRVRELEKMRNERRARREVAGSVRLRAQEAARSGKLVIEAENVSFAYGDREQVIKDFSTLIMRRDKTGIIGPNGSGKTTLLRLLLGDLEPFGGSVRHGVKLEIAYFDQLRGQLDEERTVAENVGDGNDTVLSDGKPRHIMGYLQDFLFSPERARSPVRVLSGGERNRLLLARLFARPCNLLVMDEPTNDLDVETMELLEDLLVRFQGTLLLVSHDRTFLNNVVTSTLVLEGEGRVGEYAGGYDDWLYQRSAQKRANPPEKPIRREKPRPKRDPSETFSYKEQRELESLPHTIERLEEEQSALYRTLSDPAFYQRPDGGEIAGTRERLKEIEDELEKAYERWDALDTKARSIQGAKRGDAPA